MFESKSGVLLVAGLGFFAFAILSNAPCRRSCIGICPSPQPENWSRRTAT